MSSYNDELYKLRNAGEFGKQWLADYEVEQKEKTGIKFLKTGYNRVFGYYIEVTNTGVANVPDNYIRKQTITTGERYITPELKEMEYKILNSKEQAIALEGKLYSEIKTYLASYINEFSEIAKAVALADCLISLATVAVEQKYTRPIVSSGFNHIKIEEGRHPVVESHIPKGEFVPNNTAKIKIEEVQALIEESLKKKGVLFIGSTEQISNYKDIGFERLSSFYFQKP